MARRSLSTSAWTFAAASVALGTFHAINAHDPTAPTALATVGIAVLGLLIGFFANKASRAVAGIAAVAGAAVICARLLEDQDLTKQLVSTEVAWLVS